MLRVVLLFVLVAGSQAGGFMGIDFLKFGRRFATTEPTATTATAEPGQMSESATGPLSGVWTNQHGSIIRLEHYEDGRLEGEFLSAVEAEDGSSGGVQTISGRVGKGKPTTFGMVASFKDGKSMAAWSGQYHNCGAKESLSTTWILTSQTDGCHDHWMASRVGQDKFERRTGAKKDKILLALKRKRYYTKFSKRD